ncbi:hypothetical protein [Microbispora sp. CA-102843]|uniref:hypothetical protein n=1 Tax=Microbispora sp. CA-102843 TaxID=3239952 RepID=UPI003D8D0AE5
MPPLGDAQLLIEAFELLPELPEGLARTAERLDAQVVALLEPRPGVRREVPRVLVRTEHLVAFRPARVERGFADVRDGLRPAFDCLAGIGVASRRGPVG